MSRSVSEFVGVLPEAVATLLALSFISLGLHTKPGFSGLRIDIWPGLVVGLDMPGVSVGPGRESASGADAKMPGLPLRRCTARAGGEIGRRTRFRS